MARQGYYNVEVWAGVLSDMHGVAVRTNPALRLRLWDFPAIDLLPSAGGAAEADGDLLRAVEFASGKSWTFQMTPADVEQLLPATISCYLVDRCDFSGRDTVLGTSHLTFGGAADPRSEAPGGGPGVVTHSGRCQLVDTACARVGTLDLSVALRYLGVAPPQSHPSAMEHAPCSAATGIAISAGGTVSFARDAGGDFVPVRPSAHGDSAGRGVPWATAFDARDGGGAAQSLSSPTAQDNFDVPRQVASPPPQVRQKGTGSSRVVRLVLRNDAEADDAETARREAPLRTGHRVRVRHAPGAAWQDGVVAYVADGVPYICVDGDVIASAGWHEVERAPRRTARRRPPAPGGAEAEGMPGVMPPPPGEQKLLCAALLAGEAGGADRSKNPHIVCAAALGAALGAGLSSLSDCLLFDGSDDVCRAAARLLPSGNVVRLPASQDAAAGVLSARLSELLQRGGGKGGLLCFAWGGALGVSTGWDSEKGWAHDLCGGAETATLLQRLCERGWRLAWVDDSEDLVLGTYNAVARQRGVHFSVFAHSRAVHDLRTDVACAQLRRALGNAEAADRAGADALQAACGGQAPPPEAAPLARVLAQYRRACFQAFRERFAAGAGQGLACRLQNRAAVDWLLRKRPKAAARRAAGACYGPPPAGSAAAAAAALGAGAPVAAALRAAFVEPLQRAARRAEASLAAIEAAGPAAVQPADEPHLQRAAAAMDEMDEAAGGLLRCMLARAGAIPPHDYLSVAASQLPGRTAGGPVYIGADAVRHGARAGGEAQQPAAAAAAAAAAAGGATPAGAAPAGSSAPAPAPPPGVPPLQPALTPRAGGVPEVLQKLQDKLKQLGHDSPTAGIPDRPNPLGFSDFQAALQQLGVAGAGKTSDAEVEKAVREAFEARHPDLEWREARSVHHPSFRRVAVRFAAAPKKKEKGEGLREGVCVCEYAARKDKGFKVSTCETHFKDLEKWCADWLPEAACRELFDAIDASGSGVVDVKDLRAALKAGRGYKVHHRKQQPNTRKHEPDKALVEALGKLEVRAERPEATAADRARLAAALRSVLVSIRGEWDLKAALGTPAGSTDVMLSEWQGALQRQGAGLGEGACALLFRAAEAEDKDAQGGQVSLSALERILHKDVGRAARLEPDAERLAEAIAKLGGGDAPVWARSCAGAAGTVTAARPDGWLQIELQSEAAERKLEYWPAQVVTLGAT
eukprot:TRINITY_DN4438_c0_g1_i1.p1 TRINITY_DN4438_c0_g1~~TRINITY_DN4438_c0_g1_i1.p1  ORF type:complete len:1202 (+),score=346.44 TRINITY_DN4438_c0_g1_i1:71-3676(+)